MGQNKKVIEINGNTYEIEFKGSKKILNPLTKKFIETKDLSLTLKEYEIFKSAQFKSLIKKLQI